jgi:hypothetical protein
VAGTANGLFSGTEVLVTNGTGAAHSWQHWTRPTDVRGEPLWTRHLVNRRMWAIVAMASHARERDFRSRLILLALVELDGLGKLVKLQQLSRELFEEVACLRGTGVEKLAPEVDPVDAAVSEPGVHFALRCSS